MIRVSLIIPTHNRHEYLERSILYFKEVGFEVYYCDSTICQYEGNFATNQHYLHFPNLSFQDKIRKSLDIIDSKFIALCADDDFICIESFKKGLLFIKENKDYKTVLGKNISFLKPFNSQFYKRYEVLPKSVNFTSSVNAKIFFKNYYQILWGLYDREILENTFKILQNARFENDNYIELVLGAHSCYLGGIKIMDSIWSIRELSDDDHWGKRHLNISNNSFGAQQERDKIKFIDLIDQSTSIGFANLVLSNYYNREKKSIVKRFFLRLEKSLTKITQFYLPNKKKDFIIYIPTDSSEKKCLNYITDLLLSFKSQIT